MPRQVGLRDIYIAKLTKDDITGVTYATPIKLERAISAKISPKTSSEKIYSDDTVEEIINNFDNCEVEIEVNQLSISSRALLQGATVDSGELVEKSTDIPPEVALGFRSKKTNGKYRYIWLFKGKFENAEDEYSTQTEKIESKTPKLKGTFIPRINDNAWRITADEDETEIDPTRIASWFTSVPSPLEAPAG